MKSRDMKNLFFKISLPIIILIFCGCYLISTKGMAMKILQYPYVLIGLLFLLTTLIIWDEVKEFTHKTKEGIMISDFENKAQLVKIVTLILLTVLYLVLIEIVGYFVTTWIFSICLMIWLGERKPLILIAISCGFVAVEYLVFKILLYVPVPNGFLI